MGVGAVGACLRISVWRAAAAVKLGGGMVRIKNRKFSVGSAAVKVDLNFDKFATLTVMTGEAEKITAQVPVVAVNKLPTNVIGDVVVVFLSKEANAQIFSAKTAKQFDKSSSKVCDSSNQCEVRALCYRCGCGCVGYRCLACVRWQRGRCSVRVQRGCRKRRPSCAGESFDSGFESRG